MNLLADITLASTWLVTRQPSLRNFREAEASVVRSDLYGTCVEWLDLQPMLLRNFNDRSNNG